MPSIYDFAKSSLIGQGVTAEPTMKYIIAFFDKIRAFTASLCKIAQVHLPNKNISAILRYFNPVICELAFNL